MLLCDIELKEAIDSGELVFAPELPALAIQAASVDLTLNNVFWRPNPNNSPGIDFIVNVDEARALDYADEETADEIILEPGEFILGETAEGVSLSDGLCGLIEGKSGRARHGLIVHCTAPHVAPGWGMNPPDAPEEPKIAQPLRIMLEIVNLSPTRLRLRAGTGIAQLMVVRTGRPAAAGYSGIHARDGTNAT